MIELSVHVSGGDIGSKLANDAEELAYALAALCEEVDTNDFEDVSDLIPYGQSEQVASWLRNLADAIDPSSVDPLGVDNANE